MATKSQDVFGAARVLIEQSPVAAAGKLIEHILLPEELDRSWKHASEHATGAAVFSEFLSTLNVHYECAPNDLSRIPSEGPVVVVANHPFGLVEGAILGALAARVRTDFKILANSLLAEVPALSEFVIPVNPFGGAAKTNWRPLRASLAWLMRGGMLVTFPAGEVSSLQLPKLEIADPEWNENVSRLIQLSGAASLPAYFHGVNGPGFHLAGLIHPRLRTALLPRELLNKRGRTLHVSIGRPIGAERLAQLGNVREATDYLRHRTHVLEGRKAPAMPKLWKIGPKRAPIAGAVASASMRAEVEALPADRKLIESAEYAVYVAGTKEIPNILREIGRLREVAFRKVGEGTGRALDLDRFDPHYQHLWIWNAKTDEVVGAYRMAGTDTVSSPRELYTSTLFHFRPGLLESLHPALELGRSFVRLEYQKSYVALLLLWKGIGRYVARHPRYRVLFGPVSISREYSATSRDVMMSFLETRCGNARLAAMVEPKRPPRARRLRACDTRLLGSMIADVEDLGDVVADLEPDGKGVPVLLRQYLNVGGEILAFNVDAEFSDVLDGLVTVDLTRMNRGLLDRYLGKTGAENFLREQEKSKKHNM